MSTLFYVYILHCENDTYYTGYTTDLEKRYASHVNGTGRCKYTKSFKPVSIAQSWIIQGEKALAMEIERKIKKLSRAEKEKLIAEPEGLCDDSRITVLQVPSVPKGASH